MSYNSFHPGQVWLDTEGRESRPTEVPLFLLMIPIISMARTRKNRRKERNLALGSKSIFVKRSLQLEG